MTEIKSSAKNIKISSLDDLFGGNDHNAISDELAEAVREIKLSNLHTFSHHPYYVKDDEAMEELVQSVKSRGIIEPGLCRENGVGGYEIISGHRRKRACELAGLDSMPMYVVSMDNDEAVEAMVDANLHRPHISLKEKAAAYRMKHDALIHQGKISEETTAESIGKKCGESERTIRRIIRLSYLCEELIDLIDEGKMSMLAGVDLSYINEDEQQLLYSFLLDEKVIPTPLQAKDIRKLSEQSSFFIKELESVFRPYSEVASPKKEKKQSQVTIKFDVRQIEPYFGSSPNVSEIKQKIIQLLDEWLDRQ